MVIKLVAAPIACPTMLRMVLNHKITQIAMVLKLSMNVIYSTGVVFVVTLIVNAFISWIANCGKVSVEKQNYENNRVNGEAYQDCFVEFVLSIFKYRLINILVLIEI